MPDRARTNACRLTGLAVLAASCLAVGAACAQLSPEHSEDELKQMLPQSAGDQNLIFAEPNTPYTVMGYYRNEQETNLLEVSVGPLPEGYTPAELAASYLAEFLANPESENIVHGRADITTPDGHTVSCVKGHDPSEKVTFSACGVVMKDLLWTMTSFVENQEAVDEQAISMNNSAVSAFVDAVAAK